MARSAEQNIQRLRAFRKANPEWNRQKNARYRKKHKYKDAAHRAVENAVKAGLLKTQPCEVCATEQLVHAHHDDYDNPLDVMWLCPLHHRERHRLIATTFMEFGFLTFNGTLLRLVRKGYEFTDRQKCVLFAVKKTPQTVRGMADMLEISKPAVCRAVTRLADDGYVGRKDDPQSARSILVFVTTKGLELIDFINGKDEG